MLRDHVTYVRGAITEVRCRLCGTPIRTMVQTDTPGVMGMGCLPTYREVLMECSDKSAHVACMCLTCAEAATVEQLQEHHDLDMEEMQLASLMKRTVTSKKRIDYIIE